MAENPEIAQTSSDIAHHAGTNPVVVRRVLGKLRNAGLLMSEKGHSGGWRLARNSRMITLADVYLALGEQMITSDPIHHEQKCSVERALVHKVSKVLRDVESDLVEQLSKTTIADFH